MGVSINIDSTVVNYPHNSPFHPDKIYPELENLEYIHIDPYKINSEMILN
jgi:hypothetical protein